MHAACIVCYHRAFFHLSTSIIYRMKMSRDTGCAGCRRVEQTVSCEKRAHKYANMWRTHSLTDSLRHRRSRDDWTHHTSSNSSSSSSALSGVLHTPCRSTGPIVRNRMGYWPRPSISYFLFEKGCFPHWKRGWNTGPGHRWYISYLRNFTLKSVQPVKISSLFPREPKGFSPSRLDFLIRSRNGV